MSTTFSLSDMVKIYSKPSLGIFVLRKPRTEQTSPRVAAQKQNFAEKMRGKKIATECKGRKARAFYGCLASAGHRAYHGR